MGYRSREAARASLNSDTNPFPGWALRMLRLYGGLLKRGHQAGALDSWHNDWSALAAALALQTPTATGQPKGTATACHPSV